MGVHLASLMEPGVGTSLLLLALATLAVASTAKHKYVVTPLIVMFFCCGIFFKARADALELHRRPFAVESLGLQDRDRLRLDGTVTGIREPAPEGVFILVHAKRITVNGEQRRTDIVARLFVETNDSSRTISRVPKHSDFVSANFVYRSPVRFLNPGVAKFDEIQKAKGIDIAGTVRTEDFLTSAPSDSDFSLLGNISNLREVLIDEIRTKFDPSTSGVLIASLLGDKYFLDRRDAEVFRDGGTYHVLVISGMHITIIGMMVLGAITLLTSNRLIQAALSAAIIWMFTALVGGDIPVVRAAAMFTCYLAVRAARRQSVSANIVGLCAVGFIFSDPDSIYSPSFILTFLSVGSITAMSAPIIARMNAIGGWTPSAKSPLPPNVSRLYRRFCETFYWRPERWALEQSRSVWKARLVKEPFISRLPVKGFTQKIFEGLIITACVQLWMLPAQIYLFHRLPIGGIFLGLWVEVVLLAETLTAICGLLTGQVSDAISSVFVWFSEFFNAAMFSFPQSLSTAGAVSIRPALAYAFFGSTTAFYVALFLLVTIRLGKNAFEYFAPRSSRLRTLKVVIHFATAATVLVSALYLIVHPGSSPVPDGRLHVTFLDVGQGDSIFISFPNGQTMLIDGGGIAQYGTGRDSSAWLPDRMSIGESVVSEFLWEQGYSEIDYVVATHADADHMQGLADIIGNFEIGRVLLGSEAPEDPDYEDLKAAMGRRNVRADLVGSGMAFEIAGVNVRILAPQDGMVSKKENDRSVVLRLTFKERSFLLMGDLEADGERKLIRDNGEIAADVVKAGHHGSRTSSIQNFIDRTNAKFVVISVGRTSPFGHPHKEVVERWSNSGAVILKTGERGAVTFVTDGKSLDMSRYLDAER